LSKGLVEQHEGSMMLASVPGLGTTVTVRLPGLTVLNLQTAVEKPGQNAEPAKIGS
jgi:hypothetical protein